MLVLEYMSKLPMKSKKDEPKQVSKLAKFKLFYEEPANAAPVHARLRRTQ